MISIPNYQLPVTYYYMPEQPQSLESQLKMARPRRHEVKRVPLTPEEKEFLGEIMDKAVAAEKTGKLQEALNLYTDYKNELLKIKEKKEKDKEQWDFDMLHEWVRDEIGITDEDDAAWHWTAHNFNLSEPPDIRVAGENLTVHDSSITQLPAHLKVIGNLNLKGCKLLKKLPAHLFVTLNIIVDRENKELVEAAELAKSNKICLDVIYE